jgi:hypothetical protein
LIKIKFVYTSIFVLGLLACQDLDSIKPTDEFDLDSHFGKYVDTTIYAIKATFRLSENISTAEAPKISVGQYESFESSFLIKFTSMPDTTYQIDSVSLALFRSGNYGDTQDEIQIGVFKVDEAWEETCNTDDDWHIFAPTVCIDTITYTQTESDTLIIHLSTTLVNAWRESSDNNNGLYLKILNNYAGYICEFHSFEATDTDNRPRMYYKVKYDSLYETDSTNIGQDATIFNYNAVDQENIFKIAEKNNYVLISSGIPSEAFIQFPGLQNLPKTAIVQGADLLLDIKDENILNGELGKNCLLNSNHNSSFYVHTIDSANEDLSDFNIDSSFVNNSNYLFSLALNTNTVSFSDESEKTKFGKNMVQNVINENKNVIWLYIRYKSENQDISVFRLADPDSQSFRMNIRYYDATKSGY